MSLVFGKYEKIRRIAQGGMGEVFLARQTGVLDRLAILKALRPDLAKEKEFVEQFLDEARVAATLNHPNIVAIYDVGDWNGVYYIAMEYIAGEDLSKLWYAAAKAGVGLPFQVSVRIVMEAGLGLDHAHRAKDVRGMPLNIVHRDISPQNIMVRADGVTKLVDFGIAKAANKSSRTQAGMVKGKLQYMSPEQVRGEHLDGRSDQFSLGIVIWEMCTGRRLFKADSEINTLQKILQNPIPKPSQHVPGFPPELEAIIMRMLERDPGRRFASLGDVGARLKEYLDRAGLASGEVSVAAFVQQILGKELEERTRDLTPMEPTEVGAPMPTKPPGAVASSSSHAAAAAGQMRGDRPASGPLGPGRPGGVTAPPETARRPPEPIAFKDEQDPPTAVVSPEDRPDHDGNDGLAGLPSGPSGEWVVRKNDGSVVHFQEWATLQQWVLDGKLARDDQLSTDGRKFARLGDDAQLQTFFQMAEQAAQRTWPTGQNKPQGGAPVPVDPAPPNLMTTTSKRPAVAAGETVPIGDAIENLLSEAPPAQASGQGGDQTKTPTPLTNDPFAGGPSANGVLQGGSPTGQFSLGSLPSTQTGQWQIGGELQQALAQKQAAMTAAGTPTSAPNPTKPPDPSSMVMATDPKGRAPAKRKVPPLLWAMVGVLGSFVAIALIIKIASPDTFRALRDGEKPTLSHAHAALAATRKDEPATVDALLTNLAPELTDEKATVDADVAAALLHLEKWRVLEAARRVVVAHQKLEPKKAPTELPDPAPSLAQAQKHAARAQSKAGDDKGDAGVWARFAAAVVDSAADPKAGERASVVGGVVPELADESHVNAALLQSLAALSDDKVNVVADAAIDGVDARTRSLRTLVAAVRAPSTKPDKEKDAAVDAARAAVDERLKKNPSDPRFVAAKALLGEPKKAETPKTPETPKVPDVVDAGVAVVAVPNPVVDAGVAAPPPVEEETYETALGKGQKAAKSGRTGEAAKMFRIALTKKPGDNKAELGLSWAQIDLGKNDAAAKGFKNVVTRDPGVAEAQFGLGEALRGAGRTTEAIAAYEKYLEIAPSGPDAETAKNAIRALQ